MLKLLGNWPIVGALSALAIIFVIGWINTTNESLLLEAAGADKHPGIEKVDIEFDRKTILVNVYLSKPLTCAQVISTLGIESMPIRDRIYIPVCHEVDQTLIKITYTEAITA